MNARGAQLHAAVAAPHAAFNSGTMLPLVKGAAPISLGPLLMSPQLVTPTTALMKSAAVPAVVEVKVGRMPKLTSHGPPLEPPHISEPIIVLLELPVEV